MRGIAAALCVACVIAGSGAARAEDDVSIARAHYATGLAYYDRAQYALAVNEFLAAYSASPRPELLFNIAQAYDKLPDRGRAYDHYLRYLAARPVAAERALIEQNLARIRPKVGLLIVSSSDGTEVTVDQQHVDRPREIWLEVGSHTAVAHRAGMIDATMRVAVRSAHSVEITLEPITTEVLVARVDPGRKRARWLWPVVGVTIGVVVAGTAIGLGIGLSRRDYAAEARSSCTAGCVLIDTKAVK